jgi:hypothetical protein
MSMKLSSKDLGKSYTKHLNNMPLNFSFNSLPTSFSLPYQEVNPLYSSLSTYGIGLAPTPVGVGYGTNLGYGYGYGLGYGSGIGSGPLKKGDLIDAGNLTFYDPLNPLKNNTVSLSNSLSTLAQAANTVKIYSNSELTVNIVGTEADTTKVVKILDKMYSAHKDEIATL